MTHGNLHGGTRLAVGKVKHGKLPSWPCAICFRSEIERGCWMGKLTQALVTPAILAACALDPLTVRAETISDKAPFCVSKSDLNPYFVALLKGDEARIRAMEPQCGLVDGNVAIDVLEMVPGSPAKIRVKQDGTVGYTFHNFVR